MNRTYLAQALQTLNPAARAMCVVGGLDPADAFIAHAEGLTPAQAASRARNLRRSLGTSWPDRTPRLDLDDLHQIQQGCGLHGTDALAELEAAEAVAQALAAPEAARCLRLADLREADTARVADEFNVTRRRAQQVKAEALAAVEAGQLDLFCGDEEKGSEP